MKTFKNFVGLTLKRPSILVLIGIITLIISAVNLKNPLLSLVFGSGSVSGGNIFDTAMTIIKLGYKVVTNLSTLPFVILFLIGVIVLGSVLLAFLFSGCFHILTHILERKEKYHGEFIQGVRKYFTRLFLVSLRVLTAGILFLIFATVACIPAIVITRTLISGKYELVFVALLLDIITLSVMFYGFMTLRIYVFYWYPAVLNFKKRSFAAAKHITDKYFWGILRQFVVFDLLYIVFQSLYMYSSQTLAAAENPNIFLMAAIFVANWFFKTIFYTWFLTYVFTSYTIFRSKMQSGIAN